MQYHVSYIAIAIYYKEIVTVLLLSECLCSFLQVVEDDEENTWDVLRDNYMMGSTMKDWDRNCDSDSVTEHNSDTDSGSDT